MSLVAEWGEKEDLDLQTETAATNLRNLDEVRVKELLFMAVREGDVNAIKNILQFNRSLINEKLYGYEGADVYNITVGLNSKTGRCYTYTGLQKDGYFYPIHVAAESANKLLCHMFAKAGADLTFKDYRNNTPEEVANGESTHAFYELRGLQFEPYERYEGTKDRTGKVSGLGKLIKKKEGYETKEVLVYAGTFKDGKMHGLGTLYSESTGIRIYDGRFRQGMMHGRGTSYDEKGIKNYTGTFRSGKREGRGVEFEAEEGKSYAVLKYVGDFKSGYKHGFGIHYLTSGTETGMSGEANRHTYVGRLLENQMNGFGIYCHPNGDLFEGYFDNDRLDGKGSKYTWDKEKNSYNDGEHHVYEQGRPVSDESEPFVPLSTDLPKMPQRLQLEEEMKKEEEQIERMLDHPDEDDEDVEMVDPRALHFSASTSGMHFKGQRGWKVYIAKYLRLGKRDCVRIGIPLEECTFTKHNDTWVDSEDVDATETNANIDDVADIHFMEVSILYVAYVYIVSGQKVLETRNGKEGGKVSSADFDAVYNVVVDAVEEFNDEWEKAIDDKMKSLEVYRQKQSAFSSFAPDVDDKEQRQITQKIETMRSEVEIDPEVRSELAERTLVNVTRDLLTLAGIDPSVKLSDLSALLDKWHQSDKDRYENMKRSVQMHISYHDESLFECQGTQDTVDTVSSMRPTQQASQQSPSRSRRQSTHRSGSIYNFGGKSSGSDSGVSNSSPSRASLVPGRNKAMLIQSSPGSASGRSLCVERPVGLGDIQNEFAIELLYIIRSVDNMG